MSPRKKRTAGGGARRSSRQALESPSKQPASPTSIATTPTAQSSSGCRDDLDNVSSWTPESVQQVAEWWNVEEKNVAKLWQLRDALQDVDHWKNQPNEVVRYLRDAKWNVNYAEQKFRKMVQWRIDNSVDTIVDDYQPPHPLMMDYLPTTVLEACDKGGDPIWVERVGAADSWGLFKTFGQEPLIKYAVYVREVCIRGDWARDYQRKHGKPPSRATAIIDLGGMGWDHCKPSLMPLLQEGLKIIQDYYVGFGKKVIVIRTSKLFPIIWKVAQHFCGENLKNMLVFANADNYLEVLEEYVDLESLPPCIYPQGKGRAGVAMPGRLDGGKVPSLEELDRMWEERQKQGGVPDTIKGLSSMSTASLTDESITTNHTSLSPRSVASTVVSAASSSNDAKNALQPEKWTDENFTKTMEAFCASHEEAEQIRELHGRLEDVNHWKNSPQTLMYFLRDSRHSTKLTEKRFRQMIEWRKSKNVDHVLENYRPPKLLFNYFSATLLKADCCDYDGSPIYVERPGSTDSWALYQRFGKQGILDYMTWMRESAARGPFMEAYERQHGRRFTQVSVIVDLAGLGTRHMKPGLLPLFRSIMEVSQTHYCGMAKRIFVIKAPRIFKLVWSLTHHFLNDQMKDLLVFCSESEYEEVLSEYMDINNLPPCIYENGRGEGGVGMPKELDLGLCPPPSPHDQDLATVEDIQGYATTSLSRSGSLDQGNVGVKVGRLCSGAIPTDAVNQRAYENRMMETSVSQPKRGYSRLLILGLFIVVGLVVFLRKQQLSEEDWAAMVTAVACTEKFLLGCDTLQRCNLQPYPASGISCPQTFAGEHVLELEEADSDDIVEAQQDIPWENVSLKNRRCGRFRRTQVERATDTHSNLSVRDSVW